jgi:archaellum component FlaC
MPQVAKNTLTNSSISFDTVVIILSCSTIRMSEDKLGFVGKQVKDIYGTYMGRVIGIVTEIDGEIEAIGVDTGSGGLKQLPYEQLVIQGEYVFFIPKWRLEAQKLLRQKSLTLKRIKALQDIVAENDSMKEDAELVHIKYEKKLNELEGIEKQVNGNLNSRLGELDTEAKSIKSLLFDAKLQFRSNEMKEETYQQIKIHTDELLEHITNEKTEINNVKSKLAAHTLENLRTQSTTTTSGDSIAVTPSLNQENQEGEQQPHSSNASATESAGEVAPVPVSASTSVSEEGTTVQVSTNSGEQAPVAETNWLNQVITK